MNVLLKALGAVVYRPLCVSRTLGQAMQQKWHYLALEETCTRFHALVSGWQCLEKRIAKIDERGVQCIGGGGVLPS